MAEALTAAEKRELEELRRLKAQRSPELSPEEREELERLRAAKESTGISDMVGWNPANPFRPTLNLTPDAIDTLSRNIAQPFNRRLLEIPGMLPGGDSLEADSRRLGLLAPEGQEAEGVLPRTMEIMGGSIGPGGIIAGAGRQVLARGIPAAQQSVMQNIAAQTAARPISTAVGEVLGAAGAGVGGEIAEEMSDNPNAGFWGEVLGGTSAVMAPLAIMNGPMAQMGRAGYRALTSRTPESRAAKRLQSTVVDPQKAVSPENFDVDSPMPPARQVNEPRTLALEAEIRRRGPAEETERVERHIRQTVEAERQQMLRETPGDPAAARTALEAQGDATVKRARERAQRAAEEAEKALKDIDTGAPIGDISVAARQKVDAALNAAKRAETKAWEKVGFDSRGGYPNLKQAVKDIEAEAGAPRKKESVPDFVRKELKRETAGKPVTLRDIHALRVKIGGRKGAAQKDDEQRLNLRWLNKIESALLKDMESVDAADPKALELARNETQQIYEKFRRGNLGRVLGKSQRDTARVLDVDTLRRVTSGQDVARNIDQLIGAAPEARNDVVDFIRQQFASAAVKNGRVNKPAAERFIRSLESRRVFDSIPELKDEFINATTKSGRAEFLEKAANLARERGGARLERGAKKSLASTYLNEPVDLEAGLLFGVKNPAAMAQRLRGRLEGNTAAEEGLRRSYLDAMWKRSASGLDAEGVDIHSGAKFTRLLKDNRETLQALGFSNDQVARMQRLAKMMRQAEAKPEGPAGEVMTDIPGRILQRLSQLVGARSGAAINRVFGGRGSGAGVSLQSAQMGSSTAQEVLQALRVDPAQAILMDAIDDPKLFKSLMLKDTATVAEKREARSRINAWLFGAGLSDFAEEE